MEDALIDAVCSDPDDHDLKKVLIEYYIEQGRWEADSWSLILKNGDVPKEGEITLHWHGDVEVNTFYFWYYSSAHYDTIKEAYLAKVTEYRHWILWQEVDKLLNKLNDSIDYLNDDDYWSEIEWYYREMEDTSLDAVIRFRKIIKQNVVKAVFLHYDDPIDSKVRLVIEVNGRLLNFSGHSLRNCIMTMIHEVRYENS